MANKKSSETLDTRSRSWTFVLYEDSAPSDWFDILDSYHFEWVESPWHDKDVNPTGEVKKKHKHILLIFTGKKSYEQIKEITDKLCCPRPERCHNAKSLVRYFAHLDNPDKAQYQVSDIIGHGGVDVADLLRPSSSERYSFIREMKLFVREYRIVEFQDLFDYASEYRFDDWFPLLCDNSSSVMDRYIKSQRYRSSPPPVFDVPSD